MGVTSAPSFCLPKSREAKNLPNPKWLTLRLLRKSVTSMIGMAKASLTFYLGDVMYALGMNTTKKVCVGLGQTDEEGKKFAKFDDIVEKVNAAKTTPDSSGTYHDYVELLKLYDKNSDGTMMLAELENILANLGDEIPKEDVQKLFAELCDPEDEDGFFPYMPFVDRLCGKA